MRFSQYVEENWDGDEFCRQLAIEAKLAIYKIILEMALGTEEISDPKYPIMYDADDYKFLSQFPPKIWRKALNWRYNDGLREIMRSRDPQYGKAHIPEGWDWVSHLSLPAGKGQTFVFGKPGGPKSIYVGLTELVKKLTKPPKGNPTDMTYHPDKPGSTEPHPHWPHKGPSLKEIDPNEQDPTKPGHPSNYEGGLYNFDLDKMAEVSDEDIEDISDEDMQAWLDEPYSDMDVNDPEVQKRIKKMRDEMKEVKKHTMAAYDVPQLTTTMKDLTNWITANAMPERIFGQHPPAYKDPLTGKVYPIDYKSPDYINKNVSGFLSKAEKGGTGGYALKHHIPTITKNIDYKIIDKKGNVKQISEPHVMPYMNPMRGIPQIHDVPITDEYKRELAMQRNPQLVAKWWDSGESVKDVMKKMKDAGEPIEPLQDAIKVEVPPIAISDDQRRKIAIKRNPEFVEKWWKPGESVQDVAAKLKAAKQSTAPLKAAIKIDTLKNFLSFWDDIWTPEQKQHIKDNAKSLHQVARHVFGKSQETDDPTAAPRSIYGGFRPNFKSVGQGALNVPPEKMDDFVKEYYGKLFFELTGDTTPQAGSGYQSKGKIDRILRGMEKSGDYPKEVIEGLRSKINDLATFCAFMLMTFLNDRRYGIKDDKYNLLANVPESEIDPKYNERMRLQKVQWFLKSAAQIGHGDTLTRRYREKFGVPSVQALSQIGEGGYDAEDIGGKGKKKLSMRNRRRWLRPTDSSIGRPGQKWHSITAEVPEFFKLRRNQILARLPGSVIANQELTAAEIRLNQSVENAIALYNKFEQELAGKITDPDKREAEAIKMLQDALAKNSDHSEMERDEIINKTKTRVQAGKLPPHAEKLRSAADQWMEKFLSLDTSKDQSIRLIAYDENTGSLAETGTTVTPAGMPDKPFSAAMLISEIYQYPKMIADALHKYGLRVWEKIHDAHEVEGMTAHQQEEDYKQMQAAWADEMKKWQAKLGEYNVSVEPMPMPQQQQPAAQMPQAAAAKAIGPDHFGWVNTVNNGQEMMQKGQELLAKEAELKQIPGAAQQVNQALHTLRKRRPTFMKGLPPPAEHQLFYVDLPKMIARLNAPQG